MKLLTERWLLTQMKTIAESFDDTKVHAAFEQLRREIVAVQTPLELCVTTTEKKATFDEDIDAELYQS